MSTMSSSSQPRERASARLVGREASGPGRGGGWCLRFPIWTRDGMGWTAPYNAHRTQGKCEQTLWEAGSSGILGLPPMERASMSESTAEARGAAPFPLEPVHDAAPEAVDPLASDWSDG